MTFYYFPRIFETSYVNFDYEFQTRPVPKPLNRARSSQTESVRSNIVPEQGLVLRRSLKPFFNFANKNLPDRY